MIQVSFLFKIRYQIGINSLNIQGSNIIDDILFEILELLEYEIEEIMLRFKILDYCAPGLVLQTTDHCGIVVEQPDDEFETDNNLVAFLDILQTFLEIFEPECLHVPILEQVADPVDHMSHQLLLGGLGEQVEQNLGCLLTVLLVLLVERSQFMYQFNFVHSQLTYLAVLDLLQEEELLFTLQKHTYFIQQFENCQFQFC